jgi:hypothetical protein
VACNGWDACVSAWWKRTTRGWSWGKTSSGSSALECRVRYVEGEACWTLKARHDGPSFDVYAHVCRVVGLSKTAATVGRDLTVARCPRGSGGSASAAPAEIAPAPEAEGSMTSCYVVAVARESDLPLGRVAVGVRPGKSCGEK